ncbi:MAG: formyl transferase [Myxococcales bacterium FL481]|nr:MAG: formyl transferase [Myxococcales bacterium FL481]
MKPPIRVALLASDDRASRVVADHLHREFDLVHVVIERRRPRWPLLQRRWRRLGSRHVIDQLVFQTLVRPVLRRHARDRIRQLEADPTLRAPPFPPQGSTLVSSINEPLTGDLIRFTGPQVVVVHGTSILSRGTLRQIAAPIINLHTGITPDYRGVHGAYWALAEGRLDRCGVTIHRVDEGIDTGAALAQAIIEPGPDDNFETYPLLQLQLGVQLLRSVIVALDGHSAPSVATPPHVRTKLRSHPRASRYLWARWSRGVR